MKPSFELGLPRVVTLDEASFRQACARLARFVDDAKPSAVVGVHSGGVVVAREVMRSLQGSTPPLFDVRASRRGTRAKRKVGLDAVVRRLPRGLNDALRVVEHLVREWRFERGRTGGEREVGLSDELRAWLSHAPAPRVVVVDDAVDSGETLVQVRHALKLVRPDVQVLTACVAQTFASPLVAPDHAEFRRTLVRFPWSMDA